MEPKECGPTRPSDAPTPAPAAHGGDLARAAALHGGDAAEWLDLSTGVNALAYPVAPFSPDAVVWRRLPDSDAAAAAEAAARAAYGAGPGAAVVACPGAQGAIQTLPRLMSPTAGVRRPVAAILAPSYAEHARAFSSSGWRVRPATDLDAMSGADVAVLVNPNNPDGRRFTLSEISALRARVGALIVDESFIDETPDQSAAAQTGEQGLIVLRSLGKFYGLAGVRFGAALTDPALGARLRAALGPWAVSGPALAVAAAALRDDAWAALARQRLAAAPARMQTLTRPAGLRPIGGTGLFRTFAVPGDDAAALQRALAAKRIWTRVFEEQPSWIRLGTPGSEADWTRLTRAFDALAERPGS